MQTYYQLQDGISTPKGKSEYCINEYFDWEIFPPVKKLSSDNLWQKTLEKKKIQTSYVKQEQFH